jgi:hypothetical protein
MNNEQLNFVFGALAYAAKNLVRDGAIPKTGDPVLDELFPKSVHSLPGFYVYAKYDDADYIQTNGNRVFVKRYLTGANSGEIKFINGGPEDLGKLVVDLDNMLAQAEVILRAQQATSNDTRH